MQLLPLFILILQMLMIAPAHAAVGYACPDQFTPTGIELADGRCASFWEYGNNIKVCTIQQGLLPVIGIAITPSAGETICTNVLDFETKTQISSACGGSMALTYGSGQTHCLNLYESALASYLKNAPISAPLFDKIAEIAEELAGQPPLVNPPTTPPATPTTPTEPTSIFLGLAPAVYNFYIWSMSIGGLLALSIIIYGGVLYSASGGNPGRMGEAKKWIASALFGLALLFSSFLILNTINPDLTNLKDIELITNPDVDVAFGNIVGGGGTPGGIQGLLMPPNIGQPMVDGYYQMPRAATPGLYELSTNNCGGDRDLASACGNIETIQVLYTVASAWRENYPDKAPLYIRDLNGDYLASACTSRHSTHELGTDADVLIDSYSVDDRIALAKLFIDTGYVTGILHSPGTNGSQPSAEAYRYINEVNAYFEQTQGNRLTPWNGRFARLDLNPAGRIKGHYAHFHVHVGDCFGGAAGTGVGCGVDCNTNCYTQTGCNP